MPTRVSDESMLAFGVNRRPFNRIRATNEPQRAALIEAFELNRCEGRINLDTPPRRSDTISASFEAV